jgi:transposase
VDISVLGIDIAKNVYQLHGVDSRGKPLLKKKVRRGELLNFLTTINPTRVVMEACGGANYWSRAIGCLGHEVNLISPQFVKPFVKTNKNDANDAQAICEAASRESMHYVSAKSIEQQDIQAIHRVRERIIKNRTALSNQIRGLLAEYGVVLPKGLSQIRGQLMSILEDGSNELSTRGRALFKELYDEFLIVDKQVLFYDKQLEELFSENPLCKRLSEIEGIGVISSTALVSSIGDPKVFKNGRQLSAWLGLTPKQHSSGGKTVLLGISKRGDCYLRKLLVHGARAVVYRARSKTDERSVWVNAIASRRGFNKACIAVANKNARIVWALLNYGTEYKKVA